MSFGEQLTDVSEYENTYSYMPPLITTEWTNLLRGFHFAGENSMPAYLVWKGTVHIRTLHPYWKPYSTPAGEAVILVNRAYRSERKLTRNFWIGLFTTLDLRPATWHSSAIGNYSIWMYQNNSFLKICNIRAVVFIAFATEHAQYDA